MRLRGIETFLDAARDYRDWVTDVNHHTPAEYPRTLRPIARLLERFNMPFEAQRLAAPLSGRRHLLEANPPAPIAAPARRLRRVEPLQDGSRVGIAFPHDA